VDRQWADWAFSERKRPPQMVYADLRGHDLRGADLRRATFEECDLRGADLRGCDVRGASFHKSEMAGARLEGCLSDQSTDWTCYFGDPAFDRVAGADVYAFRNYLLSRGVRFTAEVGFLWPRFVGQMVPWGELPPSPAAIDVVTGEGVEPG
jgi:Pentapeptide repeats (8 copies)